MLACTCVSPRIGSPNCIVTGRQACHCTPLCFSPLFFSPLCFFPLCFSPLCFSPLCSTHLAFLHCAFLHFVFFPLCFFHGASLCFLHCALLHCNVSRIGSPKCIVRRRLGHLSLHSLLHFSTVLFSTETGTCHCTESHFTHSIAFFSPLHCICSLLHCIFPQLHYIFSLLHCIFPQLDYIFPQLHCIFPQLQQLIARFYCCPICSCLQSVYMSVCGTLSIKRLAVQRKPMKI